MKTHAGRAVLLKRTSKVSGGPQFRLFIGDWRRGGYAVNGYGELRHALEHYFGDVGHPEPLTCICPLCGGGAARA